MRRCLLVVGIVVMLTTAVLGADSRVNWWPGERPTPKAAGSLDGVVVGYTNTTLTVKTEKYGSPIFTVNENTVVSILGRRAALKDLKKGDKVVVSYSTLRDDNVWARTVSIPRPTNPNTIKDVFGRVTALNSNSITVASDKEGTQTFGITDRTWVRIKGQEGTLDQVKIQDPVIVAYRTAADGNVAYGIRVLAEGIQPPLSGGISGQVSEISSDIITIQSVKDGTQSFGITEKTTVSVYGEKTTLDRIGLGANVSVFYTILDDGTRVAHTISIPIPSFSGKVLSVGNGGFTIEYNGTPVAFAATEQTKFTTHTYNGTLADLRQNYTVSVRGIPTGNAVRAVEVRFNPPVIKGVVESTLGGGFNIKAPRGSTYGIATNNATVILVRPRNAPNYTGTFADVKPGTPVNVGGHMTGSRTMNAIWVDLMVP